MSWTLSLSAIVLASAAVVACSTSSSGDPGGDQMEEGPDSGGGDDGGVTPDAGPPVTPDAGDPVAIAAGAAVIMAQGCAASSCHTANLSGNIEQPSGDWSANITFDESTGIGGWTESDLSNALLEGKDDKGVALCASMPRFASLTSAQIADVFAYLESLPTVTKARTSTKCAE